MQLEAATPVGNDLVNKEDSTSCLIGTQETELWGVRSCHGPSGLVTAATPMPLGHQALDLGTKVASYLVPARGYLSFPLGALGAPGSEVGSPVRLSGRVVGLSGIDDDSTVPLAAGSVAEKEIRSKSDIWYLVRQEVDKYLREPGATLHLA